MSKQNGGYKKILGVAILAAKKAGRLLVANYGRLKQSDIQAKSKNDFVTSIDKRSERIIVSTVHSHFPDHGILGEEGGQQRGKRTYWIIDPLDGTSNYIHLFPMFSVSIGVIERGKIIAGVVYDPLHKELFSALRGHGAFLNGKKIHTTSTRSLSQAFMATGIPFRARDRFSQYVASFEKISLGSVGVRRGGSAALDLAYVACGRFDGFWELDLSPWDIAAGALIIQEAGGKISDLWGEDKYLNHGDTLASNGLLHKELKSITSKIFTKVNKQKICLSY